MAMPSKHNHQCNNNELSLLCHGLQPHLANQNMLPFNVSRKGERLLSLSTRNARNKLWQSHEALGEEARCLGHRWGVRFVAHRVSPHHHRDPGLPQRSAAHALHGGQHFEVVLAMAPEHAQAPVVWVDEPVQLLATEEHAAHGDAASEPPGVLQGAKHSQGATLGEPAHRYLLRGYALHAKPVEDPVDATARGLGIAHGAAHPRRRVARVHRQLLHVEPAGHALAVVAGDGRQRCPRDDHLAGAGHRL
mmetsp:Transcript_77953/g.241623  ORF Transcript_77953/g.241623 Transcript_77953/m.241623 type:complete len:248 (+) Transcript_77953:283-1026(+)